MLRESIYILQHLKNNQYQVRDIIQAEADSVYFSPKGKLAIFLFSICYNFIRILLALNKLEYSIHIYNFLEKKFVTERIAMLFDIIEFSPSGTFFALYSNQ